MSHRSLLRRAPLALAAALLSLTGPTIWAVPADAAQRTPEDPVDECVVEDDRLAELSGLAADPEVRYAVGDGGRRLQVLVLRPDCTVQRVITAAVDPFDVEDLALGQDGRLWLADIGDNARARATIALHVLSQDGAPELYRLTYPDGPHDAEALLLDTSGVPYVVTKEALGSSGVYRPVGELSTSGTTPLELVTSVRFTRTDTEGGPLGALGSSVVTGGAVSADGGVVALRTYTDAYLFAVPDGDVVTALGSTPVRVPLPGEPQGEAIAFTPDGALLSASEQGDAGPQPIRSVADALELVPPPGEEPEPTEEPAATPAPTAAAGPQPEPERGTLSDWQAALIAIVAAAGVILVISRFAGRSRTN
ncbi:MAG TPA: hypothetical protein VGD67_09660 [Pseudonocardiaceae bacterium]